MATYKQRPLNNRHVGSGRHSPDISPKITQTPVLHHATSLAHATTPSPQSHSHSHSHGLSLPDDNILDNASDHEWTSIRHTISAKARARQEQYYRNQEQRAQEWHFVLGQHQKASASASARSISRKNKDIHSSDECEEPVASPIVSVFTPSDQEDPNDTPIRFETDLEGDRSSHFGFSDLASDDDLDEDQGWSHDDDDAHLSSTSIYGNISKQYQPFASPYSASTSSLSNLTHPSFALGHHDSSQGVGFHIQNKMPLHDGSGNFATALSGDSDQGGWDSSTSGVSSIFSSHSRRIAKRNLLSRQRPISSPEFGSVLQNIATLQGQLNHPHPHPYHHHYPHHSIPKRSESNMVSSSTSTCLYTRASKPHRQRYHGQIKLQNCSIYESEMEDIEGMVIDIPSKVGWLQIFEQALTVFNHQSLEGMDSALNPIKALAQSPFVDDLDPNATIGVSNGSTTTLTKSVTDVDNAKDNTSLTSGSKEPPNSSSSTSQPSTDLAAPPTPSTATSSSITLSSQVQMKHLRQKMSASSLDALQRLQKRQRSDMAYPTSPLASRVSVDPMYVEFMPTVVDSVSVSDTTSTSTLGKHTPTRSTSTMTGSGHPSDQDTNVLATVISTLRRFRDHVKSNLLHPEFDQESDYLSGLGFEGDLGMEWAIGNSSSSNSGEDVSKGEGSPVIVIGNMDTSSNRSKGRFFGRALPSGFSSGASTPTLSTTTATRTTTRAPSRVSSATNVRLGSECGLESLSLRHEDWSNGRGERIYRYSHRYDEGRPSLVD